MKNLSKVEEKVEQRLASGEVKNVERLAELTERQLRAAYVADLKKLEKSLRAAYAAAYKRIMNDLAVFDEEYKTSTAEANEFAADLFNE